MSMTTHEQPLDRAHFSQWLRERLPDSQMLADQDRVYRLTLRWPWRDFTGDHANSVGEFLQEAIRRFGLPADTDSGFDHRWGFNEDGFSLVLDDEVGEQFCDVMPLASMTLQTLPGFSMTYERVRP